MKIRNCHLFKTKFLSQNEFWMNYFHVFVFSCFSFLAIKCFFPSFPILNRLKWTNTTIKYNQIRRIIHKRISYFKKQITFFFQCIHSSFLWTICIWKIGNLEQIVLQYIIFFLVKQHVTINCKKNSTTKLVIPIIIKFQIWRKFSPLVSLIWRYNS